jgi:hypothetical protein
MARIDRLSTVVRAVACCAMLSASSCDGAAPESALSRSGRYGSLRDLVLYERPTELGGPFFLDSFEATRADFAEFAEAKEGIAIGASSPRMRDDEGSLPVAGIDLRAARAFAQWRRCRLPRADEWAFACTADGRDSFPWGSRPDPSRANTSDLGVFAPLPVGTFESGRASSGPYDLVGNVAEWTESVAPSWFATERDSLPASLLARDAIARLPALAAWAPAPSVFPLSFVVEAAGDEAPRETVGADFASPMTDVREARAPSDFGDRLGVRLATSPREILEAIGEDVLALSGVDRELWLRFCAGPDHKAALHAALPAARVSAAARSRWLEAVK